MVCVVLRPIFIFIPLFGSESVWTIGGCPVKSLGCQSSYTRGQVTLLLTSLVSRLKLLVRS